MPIDFSCPHCQRPGRAPDGSGGKRLRCRACRNLLTVPRPIALEPEEDDGPEPGGMSAWRAVFGFVRLLVWGLCVACCLWVAKFWYTVRVVENRMLPVPDMLEAMTIMFLAFVVARAVDGATRW